MAGQTVTVDEAKKKHCIYARKIAQVGGNSTGIAGQFPPLFIICNRVGDGFVPCLADECMKWIWVSKTNKEGYCGAS
jgi:hypothetical protein